MGYILDHNRHSSLGSSVSLVHRKAASPIQTPRLHRLGPAQSCAVCCICDHVPLDVPRRIFPLALKHIATLIPTLGFSSCWLDYLRNGKVRTRKLYTLTQKKGLLHILSALRERISVSSSLVSFFTVCVSLAFCLASLFYFLSAPIRNFHVSRPTFLSSFALSCLPVIQGSC